MSYPRFQRARDFKLARKVSGNMTLNNASWTDLDTSLDLTLAAEAGDIIEIGASLRCGSEAFSVCFDVVSIVSAAAVNSFGMNLAASAATGEGIEAWYCSASQFEGHGGGMLYTLAAGDVSVGYVTARLRYRQPVAGNKTFVSSATQPFAWWVKNLGPKDPN